MDERAFSEAVSVLSGEHGLAILRYLASGGWHIASDVSRSLAIHTTTASKFLARMHRLGFLEQRLRKSRTRSAFEYRLPSRRLALELEFDQGPEPLREALDYYLGYVSRALAKSRRLGWPGIEERMEAQLPTSRSRLEEFLFARTSGGARGIDDLKMLFREIHQGFLEIAREAMGPATARRILTGAADEAAKGREETVDRYGLRKALEA